MAQKKTSAFHDAEIAVQTRAGVAERVAEYSKGFIRNVMPQQHRDFFAELPFVILGLVDHTGYPWAIPSFGKKGFITSPSDTLLTINTLPTLLSLLELDFKVGQKVGLLGIQLTTRRRNRMNGIIDSIGKEAFSIRVEQSFGNCPQYIQTRELNWQETEPAQQGFEHIQPASTITPQVKTLIELADTFYISSRTKTFNSDTRSGIDASHRGGKPGFVKVDGNTLYFPDFRGNKFFNTLGNIVSDDRVGLTFPDHSSGHCTFITGHASILWNSPELSHFDGAERLIAVSIEKVIAIPAYLPMRGELVEYSPLLEHTGQWPDTEKRNETYHNFKLIKKEKESQNISSFYLAPVDKHSVDSYLPGQFLPLQLTLAHEQAITRNYTLSRASTDHHKSYRISVKREEKGLASRVLHDQLKPGDLIRIGKPSGQFTLKKNEASTIFISGGIGITPMMAMLESIEYKIRQGAAARPVYFIHATQNSQTQAFATPLKQMAEKNDWLKLYTIFSRPLVSDQEGKHYQASGYISLDLIKAVLPLDSNDHYYLCGSEGFMRTSYSALLKLGAKKSNIAYEFFGAGSIEADDKTSKPSANKALITFSKTKVTKEWTAEDGTLLEFAEKQGLTPPYSCRSGSCGSCACRLISGEIHYTAPLHFKPQKDEVLICCAQPAKVQEEIVIDL